MTYSIEVWPEGDVWCAKTPDKDTFRHKELAHVIGEIFTRVTAAIQHVPCHLMNASVKETGKFMKENGANCDVSITYHDRKPGFDATMNPSHPLNLYESLVTGTR